MFHHWSILIVSTFVWSKFALSQDQSPESNNSPAHSKEYGLSDRLNGQSKPLETSGLSYNSTVPLDAGNHTQQPELFSGRITPDTVKITISQTGRKFIIVFDPKKHNWTDCVPHSNENGIFVGSEKFGDAYNRLQKMDNATLQRLIRTEANKTAIALKSAEKLIENHLRAAKATERKLKARKVQSRSEGVRRMEPRYDSDSTEGPTETSTEAPTGVPLRVPPPFRPNLFSWFAPYASAHTITDLPYDSQSVREYLARAGFILLPNNVLMMNTEGYFFKAGREFLSTYAINRLIALQTQSLAPGTLRACFMMIPPLLDFLVALRTVLPISMPFVVMIVFGLLRLIHVFATQLSNSVERAVIYMQPESTSPSPTDSTISAHSHRPGSSNSAGPSRRGRRVLPRQVNQESAQMDQVSSLNLFWPLEARNFSLTAPIHSSQGNGVSTIGLEVPEDVRVGFRGAVPQHLIEESGAACSRLST